MTRPPPSRCWSGAAPPPLSSSLTPGPGADGIWPSAPPSLGTSGNAQQLPSVFSSTASMPALPRALVAGAGLADGASYPRHSAARPLARRALRVSGRCARCPCASGSSAVQGRSSPALRARDVVAGSRDPETLTEIVWSSMHGLASLARARRLRPDFHDKRMAILVDLLTSGRG
jgi:hypothetical protein